MVKAHVAVTAALAFMTYTFWESSATQAVSSAARGNPAAPIPCSPRVGWCSVWRPAYTHATSRLETSLITKRPVHPRDGL